MTTADKTYHVMINNSETGPLDLSQLKEMLDSGKVNQSTPCRLEGNPNWSKVGYALNLTPVLASSTAAVMPHSGPMIVQFPKARWVFILLGLFLGFLGMHNFYAGYNGKGVAQLLISILTGWLFIPLIIVGIWIIIDLISTDSDAQGRAFS